MSESYRRISKLFAIALLALSLGAVPATAQDADTAPSPALLEDAETYAELYGVTPDQALQRLAVQRAVGDLDAELREDDAQSFGGLWIEHEPFQVVALFRGVQQAEQRLEQRLAASPLDGLLEVRQAAFTLAQLTDKLEAAHGQVRRLGLQADVAIDVRQNRVSVLTPDPKGVRSALAAGGKIPAGVDVVEVTELMQPESSTLHGGSHGSGCTGGFTVRRTNGDLGISTAAHCGNTQTYLSTSLPFRGEDQQGNQDVQWHSACGIHDVDNRFETGLPGLRAATATRHRDNQAIGGLVCKYGRTTGRTCGEIDYKTYAPSWVTSAASTFIYVDGDNLGVNLSEPGDSGGPWYLENFAYGIHSGGGGNDSIYMPINYISSLGVSVLTFDPGPGCNLAPNAYFTYTVNGTRVDFNASGSSDPDGSIVSYHWDFDDGYSTTTTSPTTYHYYPSSGGNYLVTLTVTDNDGATDSYYRFISVAGDCNDPYPLTAGSATTGSVTEAIIVPCEY